MQAACDGTDQRLDVLIKQFDQLIEEQRKTNELLTTAVEHLSTIENLSDENGGRIAKVINVTGDVAKAMRELAKGAKGK